MVLAAGAVELDKQVCYTNFLETIVKLQLAGSNLKMPHNCIIALMILFVFSEFLNYQLTSGLLRVPHLGWYMYIYISSDFLLQNQCLNEN